ncbi:unnamed protein product, partial [Sphagnum balticum]
MAFRSMASLQSLGSLAASVEEEKRLIPASNIKARSAVLKAVYYIHNTPIKVHGALNTRTCIVTQQWMHCTTVAAKSQNLTSTSNSASVSISKQELGASSQAADIYAIGCVANQVFFREPLFDQLYAGEHVKDDGIELKQHSVKHDCFLDIVTQLLSGQQQRAPLNWTLRNGVVYSEMFEMMIECCTFNASSRPNIRQIVQAVHATADTL